MPKIKLTNAACEKLKPPSKGQVEYFDAAYPGLALRITTKGVRSWTYFGRLHGRLKRVTLGRYPGMTLAKARLAAHATHEALQAGINPKQTVRRGQTFAAAAETWMQRHYANKRGRHEVQRILNHDVLPYWGDRLIHTITKHDAVELIDRVADRGAKTMANRLHTHLHSMLRWSARRGIIDANPMADMPKIGLEVSRDRILDDKELKKVWRAADKCGYPYGYIVKLLVLTGARRSEIAKLRWPEVDGDEITLTGERTKTGRARQIPLSAPVVALLGEIRADYLMASPDEWIFTTTQRTPVSGWSRAKREVDARIAGQTGRALDPPWRFHDLRRTVASGLQRLGISPDVRRAVLGHTIAGISGVYERYDYKNETRTALNNWANHLNTTVRGTK